MQVCKGAVAAAASERCEGTCGEERELGLATLLGGSMMAQPCLHLRQSFAGTPLAAPQMARSAACPLRQPTRMAQSLQVMQKSMLGLSRNPP